MKFSITLSKEEYDMNGFLKDKDRRTIYVEAPTCCEAVASAMKKNKDWTVIAWKYPDGVKKASFHPETKYEKEVWPKVLKLIENMHNTKNIDKNKEIANNES